MRIKTNISVVILFFIAITSAFSQYTINSTIHVNKSFKYDDRVVLAPGFRALNVDMEIKPDNVAGEKYIIQPTEDKNYIRTLVMRHKFAESRLAEDNATGSVDEQIVYYDDLGREEQSVFVKQSMNRNDLITHSTYDEYGRSSKQYASYASTSNNFGAFDGSYLSNMQSYFENIEDGAYWNEVNDAESLAAKTIYESSSLNRAVKQGSVGEIWQPNSDVNVTTDHVVRTEYGVNAQYEVMVLGASFNNELINSNSEYIQYGENDVSTGYKYYYPEGALLKITVYDENGNKTEVFSDEHGRDILKVSYVDQNTPLKTYFVYNPKGELVFVVPPKLFNRISTATFPLTKTDNYVNELGYFYDYDHRGRLIEKKLPGAESQYYIYDKYDRLVLSYENTFQDLSNIIYHWHFFKYDKFDRPIIEGMVVIDVDIPSEEILPFTLQTDAIHIEKVRELFDNSSYDRYETMQIDGTYTRNLTHPSELTFAHSFDKKVAYYDKYTFDGVQSFETDASKAITKSSDQQLSVIGQITGTSTNVTATNHMIDKTFYYDYKYRSIQEISSNLYPDGSEVKSVKFNFTGMPLKAMKYQSTSLSSEPIVVRTIMAYDEKDRLMSTKQKVDEVDDAFVELNSITYNDLGEVKQKKLHNGAADCNYDYNIRGWIKKIESVTTEATRALNYEYDGASIPNYNGNISTFTTSIDETTDTDDRLFTYSYDGINRLMESDLTKGVSSPVSISDFTKYLYDANGNILSIDRKDDAGLAFDNLDMVYSTSNGLLSTNKLISLIDNGIQTSSLYEYNDAGSMTYDARKDINVSYNYLNLPEKIYTSSSEGETLLYQYNADGKVVEKKYTVDLPSQESNITYYVSGIEYNTSNGNIIIHNEEGYTLYNEGVHYYYFKDHLGNNLVTYSTENGDFAVTQESSYYPFGKTMAQTNNASAYKNNYLYNGKEIQEEAFNGESLDWYNYGWRFYDGDVPHFITIDRYAENFPDQSPYHYAANNPILNIDINGDSTYTYNMETGALNTISDIGGNEQQIVNFVDGEGKAIKIGGNSATAIIDGASVYVTEASDGMLVSSYDATANLPDGYNSESGYEYTTSDLVARHKLAGTSLGGIVAGREARGNAGPISSKTAYDAYVNKWGTDKAFWHAIEEGYWSPASYGGTLRHGTNQLIKGANNSSTSFNPAFGKVNNNVRNSWNQYQKTHAGSGKSKQQLAKDYNKMKYGK